MLWHCSPFTDPDSEAQRQSACLSHTAEEQGFRPRQPSHRAQILKLTIGILFLLHDELTKARKQVYRSVSFCKIRVAKYLYVSNKPLKIFFVGSQYGLLGLHVTMVNSNEKDFCSTCAGVN